MLLQVLINKKYNKIFKIFQNSNKIYILIPRQCFPSDTFSLYMEYFYYFNKILKVVDYFRVLSKKHHAQF